MRIFRYESWPTIMVIGAFFMGAILFHPPGKWELGWEMVSGLGTMLATGVALFISGNEERRLKKQQEVQAIILASRISLPLAIYTAEVKKCAEFFEETAPIAITYTKCEEMLATINRLLEGKVIGDMEIEKLIGLGDNTAPLIASAYGHLHCASSLIATAIWYFAGLSPNDITQRNSKSQMIALALNDAYKQLSLAVQRCQLVAFPFTSAHGGVVKTQPELFL